MRKSTHDTSVPIELYSLKSAISRKFLTQKTVLFTALSLLFFFNAFAQNMVPEHKIDPAFKYVFNQLKTNRSSDFQNFPSLFKIEPTEGFVSKDAPVEKRYECIVYTKNAGVLRESGIVIHSVLPTFVTAWATIEQIEHMATLKEVNFISAPQFDVLHNDVAVGNSGASLLHQSRLNNTPYKGKNVIVAIYDTGIDWKHFDFRNSDDTTKSRILRIWDQTINSIAGEAPPAGFTYGVEYTQIQINDEIDGTPTGIVRERDTNGHGTHVAGTAAGNGAALPSRKYVGMAPEADIIVVKGGNGTFSNINTINAVTYLKNLATTLGRPIVLNMSIGGQAGPHDGTLAHEVAVDDFTASAPGRVVVISAGNDNGSAKHKRLTLAPGATGTVQISVPAGTAGTDVFQFSIFASNTADITATATAPDGSTGTSNAGDNKVFPALNDSFRINLNNSLYPTNGMRWVNLYINRNGSNTISPAGIWSLSITNNSANIITMDGWLNYVSTSFGSTVLLNGDNEYLVASPGNATSAITVASYVGKNSWYSQPSAGTFTITSARQDSISSFSARGPRRDGLQKPEIAAMGQSVASTLSSSSVPSNSSISVTGLYVQFQGTSMSAPGVTGAVALLLQANPNATALQIKNQLINNTTKDAMTELPGPTPNTTWGYGKLDVFKAASSLFNCLPANRKTYQYDASTRYAEESGITLTTTKVAVRFTPDMTGKLGGVYFHASATSTSLILEIRDNNAGNPGTLLGSVTVDSVWAARHTWNYIDVSNLNITVTNATDYFVVLYRNPANPVNWSLRREAIELDNRSLTSTNGTTWTNPGVDYKIRSVVYNNGQQVGTIAQANSADTRSLNSSNQFINSSCQLIAQVLPTGVDPVSGTTTSKVWIEPAVMQYNRKPYVQRHYEITPASGASTATGRVTLYFTQAEFNNFNADASSTLDLPASATDDAGKSNLRVVQFPGTSNDASGLPGTYSGTPTVIDPADGNIIWNSEVNRWEITFDVTGFSGFIVQTDAGALPIVIEFFKGNRKANTNVLEWKVYCLNTAAEFEIERSGNGIDFTGIGKIVSTQGRCSQPFSYTDVSPLAGKNYYRIKVIDLTTRAVRYTSILMLESTRSIVNTLYPTVITKGQNVQVSFGGAKGTLSVNDATGKQLYQRQLTQGVQSINLPLRSAGVYFYQIHDDKKPVVTGRIVVK